MVVYISYLCKQSSLYFQLWSAEIRLDYLPMTDQYHESYCEYQYCKYKAPIDTMVTLGILTWNFTFRTPAFLTYNIYFFGFYLILRHYGSNTEWCDYWWAHWFQPLLGHYAFLVYQVCPIKQDKTVGGLGSEEGGGGARCRVTVKKERERWPGEYEH